MMKNVTKGQFSKTLLWVEAFVFFQGGGHPDFSIRVDGGDPDLAKF